jgi:hypothetical protein
MTRGGAVQQCANGVNCLAVAANDPADVALAQLHFEDGHLAAGDLRQHHIVRKFHELANDKLEKLLHVDSDDIPNNLFVTSRVVATALRRRVCQQCLDRARRLHVDLSQSPAFRLAEALAQLLQPEPARPLVRLQFSLLPLPTLFSPQPLGS